jgi:hypothetical protein
MDGQPSATVVVSAEEKTMLFKQKRNKELVLSRAGY